MPGDGFLGDGDWVQDLVLSLSHTMAMSSFVTFILVPLLPLLLLFSFPPPLSPAPAVEPRASRMLVYSATKPSQQSCHLLLLSFCIQPGFS